MLSQVISVASVLLLALAVPAAGAQLITPDEAKAAVRASENSPSLQFGSISLEGDVDGPEWQHTHDYRVDIAGSPDPTWSWSVNAVTGEVNTAIYGDAIPDDCMGESPGPGPGPGVQDPEPRSPVVTRTSAQTAVESQGVVPGEGYGGLSGEPGTVPVRVGA